MAVLCAAGGWLFPSASEGLCEVMALAPCPRVDLAGLCAEAPELCSLGGGQERAAGRRAEIPAVGDRGAPGDAPGQLGGGKQVTGHTDNTVLEGKVSSGKGLDLVLHPSAGSGKLQSSNKAKPRLPGQGLSLLLGSGGQICCPMPAHV